MEKGITLLELLMCIAIVIIVSTISVPPLKIFIAKQGVTSDVSLLINIINTARSKSISYKEPIRICGVEPDKACSSNWHKLKVSKPDSKRILYSQTLNNDYKKVSWSAFQRKPGLTIMPNGFTGHQNGTLYLCHSRYPSLHRALTVSKSGRVTVKRSTESLQKNCGM